MMRCEGDWRSAEEATELIPGLPNEVAEQCLLRLPFPYSADACAVSANWRSALHRSRRAAAIPHVFTLAASSNCLASATPSLRLLALDLNRRRWIQLPPPPLPSPVRPDSLSSAALPSRQELFLLGGVLAGDTHAPTATSISYTAMTNSWTILPPMPAARAFFAAASARDRVFAAGGPGGRMDSYDPIAGEWSQGSSLVDGCISRYDSVAIGRNIYITEGWTWPFDMPPRGMVYCSETDTWREMAAGMVEGWTGAAVVVGSTLFVISETGRRTVKVYDEKEDTWRAVSGGGVPEQVKKPYVAAGAEGGWLLVVGSGLSVGLGRLSEEVNGFRVEWQLVQSPKDFSDLGPISSHVLYV